MESNTSSNRIQVKVMSGKDLRAFNFFQKLSIYAIVSMVSDDPGQKLEPQQQQRTPPDKEGDGNPEWNHVMEFNLIKDFDRHHLFLHFDLRSEGLVFGIGDKAVGEVRVPLDDLVQPESNEIMRFVSYQVRSGDGKPNGVLNFSYKAVINDMAKTEETGCSSPSPVYEITGFPILNQPTAPPSTLYPTLELESPQIHQQIQYPYPEIGSMHQQHYQLHHPPPPPPPPPIAPFGYYTPPPPPLHPPPPPLHPPPTLFPPPPPYHQHHPPDGVYSWGPNPYWGRFDG